MTNFEDHLWSHLVAHGADAAVRRAPPLRRRRPQLMASTGAAVLLAVAVGLFVALSATNATSPAWAVTTNNDGTITLMISQVANLPAVNNKLAQDGIRARIVPLKQNCPTILSLPMRDLQPSTQPWSTDPKYVKETGPVGSWTVGIIPGRIPPGRTLVFALQGWHHKGWEMVGGFVKGSGPQCAAEAGNGLTILSR